MGLKAVHLFFIVASVGISVYFGIWCLNQATSGYTITGIASLLSALGILFYGSWFLKKLRGIGYLAIAIGLCSLPTVAQACAVCVGDPNSAMMQGTRVGVVFLLGVVATTLVGFASLFLFWARRQKAVDRLSR